MPTDRRTRLSGTSSCEPRGRRVGHGARVLDQRLHPAERFGENEKLCTRAQFACGTGSAAQLQAHHAAETGHLPGARHRGWDGWPDRGYSTVSTAGMPVEEFGDQRGVFAVLTHPQHQRLESTHGQVRVERSRHRTGAVLQERECRVQFLVVGQQGAAHHIGVSTDVLGGRVQHDVGTQQQWLLQRRRGKRVVRQLLDARGRGDLRYRGDVGNAQQGLVGVSTQISRVRGVSADRTASRSLSGTGVWVMPHCGNTLSMSRNVPP